VSAPIMLLIIACVVAVLSFTLAVAIWAGHPIETAVVECGTLRAPRQPPAMTQTVSLSDPASRIEMALAPERCNQAHASALFGHRMALAAGGAATATAVAAVLAEQRSKHHYQAEHAAAMQRANGQSVHDDRRRAHSVIDLHDGRVRRYQQPRG